MSGGIARLLIFCLVMVVSSLCPYARAAWDFTLSGGSAFWYYGQYVQLGDRGFFGKYDRDASVLADFAPLNGWVGNRSDVNFLTAGTNASTSGFGINTIARLGTDWVKARGNYYINAYTTSTTQGSFVAVSSGQLATWAVETNLPVFKVSYGKQEFSPGLMLQFGNTRTKEYLLLERGFPVPNVLGVLVGSGLLPPGVLGFFDGGREWQVSTKPEAEADLNPVELDIAKNKEAYKDFQPNTPGPWSSTRLFRRACYEPGFLSIGLGFMPWEKIQIPTVPSAVSVSWNLNDINAAAFQNFITYLKYYSTDLEIGIGNLHLRTHQGPELQSTAFRRVNTPTKETYTTEGWFYVRYNNGRYFLGTEFDWFNRIWRYQRSQTGLFQNPDVLDPALPALPEFFADGSGRSRFAPQYWESWRFMVECGLYYCASSTRLFYAYLPGQDRRHGIIIDRQPFIQETRQQALGLLDPYSILMSYLYGGGINAECYINAASVYALKFDYMIAANLGVECSVLYARRTSNGYGMGYVRPDPAEFGRVNYDVRGGFAASAPAIPENDLGWEFMSGLMWKLAENGPDNFTLEARAACWLPGKWFNYACIDRSIPNWDNPGPGNNWGVNPQRQIDPMFAFELRFGASY
ncbi:MAG TPA: hypothetical protein VK463_11030 [Desulfomonilaceae bacterium]|nr:hypothetical protein [Desulfomonilaceae bacterium]